MKAQLFTDILKTEYKEEKSPEKRPAVDDVQEDQHIEKTENSQQFNIMNTDDDKRLIFGLASVAI